MGFQNLKAARDKRNLVAFNILQNTDWIDSGDEGAIQYMPAIEVPDGARTTFSFAQAPTTPVLNGLILDVASGFVISGLQITFANAPGATDTVAALR